MSCLMNLTLYIVKGLPQHQLRHGTQPYTLQIVQINDTVIFVNLRSRLVRNQSA